MKCPLYLELLHQCELVYTVQSSRPTLNNYSSEWRKKKVATVYLIMLDSLLLHFSPLKQHAFKLLSHKDKTSFV